MFAWGELESMTRVSNCAGAVLLRTRVPSSTFSQLMMSGWLADWRDEGVFVPSSLIRRLVSRQSLVGNVNALSLASPLGPDWVSPVQLVHVCRSIPEDFR